jgi:hypothetical protein
MSKVSKLLATDETFREVADLLFGDGADELVAKMSPDGADLHVRLAERKKKNAEKTQARIGLASNIVGLAAGVAGTKDAYAGYKASKDPRADYKGKHTMPEGPQHRGPSKSKTVRAVGGSLRSLRPGTKALAAGALGLQVGNIAGDAVANRVLARASKDDKPKKKDIKKNLVPISKTEEIPETGTKPKKHGALTRAVPMKASAEVVAGTKKFGEHGPGKLKRLPAGPVGTKAQGKKELKKNFDVVWEGEISKVDEDKRQVFGWASIVEMNGEKVVDLQGDYIAIDEVEKSAYEYVHKSRKGGDMHLRDNFGEPKVGSHMIESFVVTPEKKEALGLPAEMPTGWWVGYQVNDDELWGKVKSGERTGFSIHGRGVRTPA